MKNHKTALLYNLKRIDAHSGDDSDAEFDRQTTIDALQSALEKLGHTVTPIEANQDMLTKLVSGGFTFAFSIAEGRFGRAREAQVPALLEFLQIPYVGSDPTTLALAHDKALAKRVFRSFGLHTAPFVVLHNETEPFSEKLSPPFFVKPLHEGSSKGIHPSSFCQSEEEARAVAKELIEKYQQPALMEEYLSGRDFTVALVGNPPQVLPILEMVYEETAQPTMYDFDIKIEKRFGVSYPCPAPLEASLAEEISALAKGAFLALGCRDVSRVDIRLDRSGRPALIEVNPLPGIAPGWSDLVTIARAAGMEYDALVEKIVTAALGRLGAHH